MQGINFKAQATLANIPYSQPGSVITSNFPSNTLPGQRPPITQWPSTSSNSRPSTIIRPLPIIARWPIIQPSSIVIPSPNSAFSRPAKQNQIHYVAPDYKPVEYLPPLPPALKDTIEVVEKFRGELLKNGHCACPNCLNETVGLPPIIGHRFGYKYHICHIPGCGRLFSQMPKLTTHLREHFNETKTKYSCSICEKGFSSETGLAKHSHVHATDRPYTCSFCLKKYLRKHHLVNHIKTHLKEEAMKETACNLQQKPQTIVRNPYPTNELNRWMTGDGGFFKDTQNMTCAGRNDAQFMMMPSAPLANFSATFQYPGNSQSDQKPFFFN